MLGSMVSLLVMKGRVISMGKYTVSFTWEDWFEIEIEAESEDEALQKWHEHDWEWSDAIQVGGQYGDDDLTVDEVK